MGFDDPNFTDNSVLFERAVQLQIGDLIEWNDFAYGLVLNRTNGYCECLCYGHSKSVEKKIWIASSSEYDLINFTKCGKKMWLRRGEEEK